MTGDATGLLRVEGLSKSFGGVEALSNVSFELDRSEALAIVGENGAGKSTLINILSGKLRPDAGDIHIDGVHVDLKSPKLAMEHGIATVHQHTSLVPKLTVAQNVELGRETGRGASWILTRRLNPATIEALALVGLESEADRPVDTLTLAERQLAAIARAYAQGGRILVFDEPTASLSPIETAQLFTLIARIRLAGVALIYVTHRLEELVQVTDRVTVMRSGHVVASRDSTVDEAEIISLMTGQVEERQVMVGPLATRETTQRTLLSVENLEDSENRFSGIDLSVKSGEILGLVGLPDSGALELLRALAGVRRRRSGQIAIEGRQVPNHGPRSALRAGIGYLAGDRTLRGVMPNMNVRSTITLSALPSVTRFGLISRRRESAVSAEIIEKCRVRCASIELPITSLSGGNQQKTLLARALAVRPRVLVCEDPTAGVDPASRAVLHELLRDLCERGGAVVINSSDLRELVIVCDRVAVLWRGAVLCELDRASISVDELMRAQFNQQGALLKTPQ